MRVDRNGTQATLTLDEYPDLLAIRALPDYRFTGRNTVECDAADLELIGVGIAPVKRTWEIVGPLFDYQRWIVDRAVERERFALFALTGTGKAQPVDEPVLTPTGWVKIGDLAIGDQVIAGDGTVTGVTGVHPQGLRSVAEVTFTDGAATRCDWDHLWTYTTDHDACVGKPVRTDTLRFLYERGLASPAGRLRWRVPIAGPVQHPHADLPIDPYVLGVLLGDGSFRSPMQVSFTSSQSWIVDKVRGLLPDDLKLARVVDDGSRAPSWRVSQKTQRNHNPYMTQLREWGLWGLKSPEKFLPSEYLTASESQRLALLHGLMDTDGYSAKSGATSFSSSSLDLAESVMALVRSLGGVAKITTKIPTYTYKGEKLEGHRSYTVSVRLPVNPFTLPRKADLWRGVSAPTRKIAKVEEVGEASCVCISVAHPSQLYVTRDYVVTHNTIMQLEWARIVTGFHGGRTLIVAPLGVCAQTIRECERFYRPDVLEVANLTARKDLDEWLVNGSGVGITNYEKFDNSKKITEGADDVGSLKYQQGDKWDVQAVVLDESSMLRGFGSRKYAIVRAFDGVRWKLCCSATPAPNQRTEFAQHAVFLGIVRSTTEYLTAYFMNRDGDWEFKPHAFDAWISNLASWAVFLRDPHRWGFAKEYDLPELVEEFPQIDLTDHQLGRARVHETGDQSSLFGATPGGITSRTKLAQISNGFELVDGAVERFESLKPVKVAELANERHADQRVIVWIKYREEGQQLAGLIPDAIVLDGQTKRSWRDEQIEAFAAGTGSRVLVAMQSMFSHGLNLQACDVQIFSTQDDSFERRFQSIRRSLRFGRTQPVTVYTPLTQLDQAACFNTLNKASVFEEDSRRLEDAMIGRLRPQDTSEVITIDTTPAIELDRTDEDRFTLVHGDSIAHMPTMEGESIDLAVFSPPFAALYAYSKALGDMGNVRADTEFRLQWQWFAERLLPIMKPGRVVAIHAKEIIRFANSHGYRHCYDFPSDLRDGMVDAGFRYHRRITIWKNPQLEATRNKETSLLHVTAIRDAANSFPQTGEYLMVFTAPGENESPIVHSRDRHTFERHTLWMNTIWDEPPPQENEDEMLFQWLYPDGPQNATAWHGVRETDVLTAATAKDHPGEKHVCPLQLGLIDRCVELWTNPGEVVFSPFAGIGSEGWSALGLGRRFYGVELKRSYYDTALRNLRNRVVATPVSLFDDAAV